jgi:transcriptional regulator with XRE-family HTH domain
VGSSRRGRHAKEPLTATGALIVARLNEANLSTAQFATRLGVSRTTVWRLLQGRTSVSYSVSIGDICRALALSGEDEAAFVHAYIASLGQPATRGRATATAPTRASASDAMYHPAETPTDSNERAARERLRVFLRERRKERQLTFAALAERLDIKPSTLVRLLRGEVQRTHAFSADRVIASLRLEGMARRQFLTLAAEAGLFAVSFGFPTAVGRFLSLEREMGTLDDIEREVIALRERRNRGEVLPAAERARILFERLYDHTPLTSSQRQSPELAHVRLLVGFEYAEAQAASVPWYERAASMIGTLNRMEREVLLQFPPKQFPSEYGHVINLRAPQYRSSRDADHKELIFGEDMRELTRAIEDYRRYLDRREPSLYVELLRNRAHLYLLSGDQAKWRADLEAAERVASSMSGAEGEQFRALVIYSWGEGYKRSAIAPGISARERQRLSLKGIEWLRRGRDVFERHVNWEGYALLAGIAEAQCLTWLDADAAIGATDALTETARLQYPALVQKVARARRLALRVAEHQQVDM